MISSNEWVAWFNELGGALPAQMQSFTAEWFEGLSADVLKSVPDALKESLISGGITASCFEGNNLQPTVMLLVDISRSGLFGTVSRTKRDMIAEIAAVLSFSAIINNDKVGAILFSDRVEKFIPPKKGRSQLLHILREVLEYKPQSDGTDIGEALRFATGAIKKRCTAFILSDMIDTDPAGHPRYEDALKVASGRHDLSAIRVYDPREKTIPSVGLVHAKDAETGETSIINTSSRKVRSAYSAWWQASEAEALALLRRSKVDFVEISTEEDYVKALVSLFRSR